MMHKIMEGRYQHLKLTLEGYKQTGYPLIEYNGIGYQPTYVSDDIGIYCLIPQLAYFFGLTIDQAIPIFFNTISWVAALVGIVGFCFLYKKNLERFIAASALILLTLFTCHQTMDVYRAYTALAISIIPWALYFTQKKHSSSYIYVFSFLAGLSIGLFHYIRAHSGSAVIIFILVIIGTHKLLTCKKKILSTLSLCIGILLPMIYFNYQYTCHVDYARKNLPNHTIDQGTHVFWHAVYLGFGFLDNNLGIRFQDPIAYKKVLSIDPTTTTYPTQESELILKSEVFNLIRSNKLFCLYTLWAKIGILLFFFLLFAHVGIPCAYLYPKGWCIESAFAAALFFSSLFPILTIPALGYSLCFISFSTLYGIVSINNALEHGIIHTFFKHLKRR